jgi:hypothetical protein
MHTGLLVLAVAFGVLLGFFGDAWGYARAALCGVVVAVGLGGLDAVVDGRQGVVVSYIVQMAVAIAMLASITVVIRAYT